ncbi:MAG: spondin domain-containing protein [Planctomycetota bacterium]
MKPFVYSALTTTTLLAAPSLLSAQATTGQPMKSVPSVVVTLENVQPGAGVFLTPPWVGIHDGTFDSYDGGSPASVPLGGNEIEALAEDGNNGPITATFDVLQPGAPQVGAAVGPSGPLAPGQRVSFTLNVDPLQNRYFSYGSMVIPSNDTFIANGNPLAHQLFDATGAFVGQSFIVSGDETNDAGTEVNDEIAGNVAFLAQPGPNIGVTESLPVTTPSGGFAAPGTLMFPNGVLNHPGFMNADFNDADDRLLKVSFRYVDLGMTTAFQATLSNDQEVQADVVDSGASGMALLRSRGAINLGVMASTEGLSGPITMAHLHLAQAGFNGDVIVDLGAGIMGDDVRFMVTAADLTGPMAGASFVDFLNEVAAGNVYINIHTAQFPAGELRGQVTLSK